MAGLQGASSAPDHTPYTPYTPLLLLLLCCIHGCIPAVHALQAAVLGMDLRAHDTLRFAPGEVRRLELSTLVRDDSPMQIPCPRPPQCR